MKTIRYFKFSYDLGLDDIDSVHWHFVYRNIKNILVHHSFPRIFVPAMVASMCLGFNKEAFQFFHRGVNWGVQWKVIHSCFGLSK